MSDGDDDIVRDRIVLFLGGQSIHAFDYTMAESVAKEFRKRFFKNVERFINYTSDTAFDTKEFIRLMDEAKAEPKLASIDDGSFKNIVVSLLSHMGHSITLKQLDKILKSTIADTDKETYQAMEALVHNLCSMHSRAGSQVPFSSINYGTDTSPEGRMAIKNILLATEAGLGHGETAIFPIHVFRILSGVNYNPEDPNYDMFKLACRVSAKRLFPNFMNIDAPFNKMYYKGTPDTLPSTINTTCGHVWQHTLNKPA